MHLKSLELTGFKSFSKRSNLHFTTSITSIVGPNGSGKSNIAEAFRFVLGEQSIKSLRGKKGEDLIWNGGGESGRANRASVRLIFDNTTKIFPSIDFDEVTIERVVNRDGTNEYILNNSVVRLKDIVELLSSAHIGATGHHIISQGEADRILSASIRERREMIEDALGLKIYQWKKLESVKKLEKTEENMKQVESLRKEVAPHLKFLKKQVEKVEKAQEMRRELTALFKEYFGLEDFYISTQKSRLEGELLQPKKELEELDKSLAKAREILTSAKNKDHKSEELIELESQLAKKRSEKDSIVRELGKIEGEINANKRNIEKEKDKQKKEEFQTVYLKDVESMMHDVEAVDLAQDIKSFRDGIITLLKGFIQRHRTSSDSSFIAEATKDIERLEKDKKHLERQVEDINNLVQSIFDKYNTLKEKIESEKDTNREAEKEVFRIIARQNEVRNDISRLNNELGVILRDEEKFKRHLGEAGIIAGREAVTYDKNENINDPHFRKIQEERELKIEKLKIRIEDAGAGSGGEIMKEYNETLERDAFLSRELEDLNKAKTELLKLISDLDMRIDYEFKAGIMKINSEFQKYFSMMFGGGKAELALIKEAKRKSKSDIEELNEAMNIETDNDAQSTEEEEGLFGLEVNVNLPRKKVKSLVMLSGGERALTSIALLFAVSQVNPPPFIILDETDAALDEANSKKYGDMIENLSKHSQLILITHNRETMSRAGAIYGITMGSDGASRLLSIAFEEAVQVAK